MRGAGILVVLVLAANPGYGQHPLQFRSTEWLGLSTGQAGGAGILGTVNGVAWGPWFTGLGASVDYYRFRSVPLFLSVTRDISLGRRDRLYLYANGGTNVPWYTRPNMGDNNAVVSSTFQGGAYWGGGLGYLWKLGNQRQAIVLSAGYAVKKLSEDQVTASTCAPLDCNMARYEYLNRMFEFMIGFRW
ncbi:MAG TPA: hypothetical protein VMH27_08740 [Puia sp.]|nr:hypothetical protein [Puia sp.]